MEDRKFEIIQQLMEELQEYMQPSGEEIDERLGRKKPGVEVAKIEIGGPDLESKEEMLGEDLDGDMEMGEDPEHAAMILGDESPEEKLKSRLMKMRG